MGLFGVAGVDACFALVMVVDLSVNNSLVNYVCVLLACVIVFAY